MKKKLSLLMIALVAIAAFAVQVSRRAATEVANIAALNVLENGAEFNFTGEALVVYQNGNYVYVKDDTGSTLIYKKDVVAANSIGKTIEANWTGKVSIYNKLFEVVPDAETLTLKEGDPVTVTYPEATIADVTVANVNKIVKLTDVTIASVSGKDFKIKKGDVTVAGYNQFAVEGLASGLVCTEMVGAISVYNDAIQFQPISFTVATPAPDPVDVVISPETGADISAALSDATATAPVKSVTINLAKDGAYTLTSTIKAPAVTINGNGATIDASAGDNIVGIEGVTEFAKKADGTDSDHSLVSAITFKDVTIKGMKKALIRDLMTKTLLETLTIDNCVMQASNGKPFIDFDGRGYVGKVVVKNSTIWAAAPTDKNFAKYGSRPKNVNEALLQEFDIQNSTIVNIGSKPDFSGGQNFNNLKQNGTAQNVYTVKNNIFVNCGKSGQVIVGLNNGQTSATPVWDVDGNAFNWNDADVSATEVSKAAKHKVGEEDVDIVQNSVEGVVAFKDAANGDFTLGDCAQYTKGTGDPRWIVKVAKDITIAPESGDIAAALTAAETDLAYNEVPGNITINLAENGAYTVSAPIVVPANLTIISAGATIDASGNDGDFITLNGSTTFAKKADGTDSDHFLIDMISILGVKITGLKGAFVKDSQKTLVNNFGINLSVIEMPATNKNFLDFNGKGYVGKVVVYSSTIYAKDKNTGFFAQYGSRPKNVNGDWLQEFDVQNSTIVNIANGKNICDLKQNGTAQNVYTLKNNIFVDCGKSSQVVVGFNKGQTSATPVWNVDGNIFNAGGEDKSAAEVDKAGKQNDEDIVKNSVAGVVTFTNAAEGDFNGNCQLAPDVTVPTAAVGDPRWTIMYKESPIKTIWKSAEAVALSWGTGVDVEKANTDIIQVGDVIHVAVEGVTASDNAWSAQVALYDQQWAQLENGTPVGTGTVTDAAIVVTGDMLALIKANGLKIAGDGYSTKQVTVERGVYMGSEKSIWVGDATLTWTQASATKFHFINTNVTAGQIIKLTYEATGNPNIQFRYGWGSEDVYGEPTYGEGFATVAVSAEAVDILKDKGLIINADGIRLTQMELLPAPPVDIVISPASGDIFAALTEAAAGKTVGNITVNLTAGVNYTVSAPIVAPASLTINGNGAIIDASALEAAMITTPAGDLAEWMDGNLTIKDVTIKGVKKGVYASAGKNYLYNDFLIENSVIEITATGGFEFDFRKGGVAKNFTINKSTIYAPEATGNSLYTSQSAQRGTEAPGVTVQTFAITNSTLYNLAKGKNFFTHRQSNQKWLAYTIKNSIFLNVGKSGQVVKGINQGQAGANPTWDIDNNIFNFDGADTSASEDTGDAEEPVKNSVAGVVTFTDAANGDFNGTFAPAEGTEKPAVIPGDPRWTIKGDEPSSKFYIIGLNGNWDRTNMIEMTRNESGRYEYEFTTETQVFFAFADKQMTAEEAEADLDWSVFNSFRYSLGDGDVEYTQLGEIKSLVKGAANGTITLKPGTFKITVEPDFNAVTITGEFAPEPQPVTVDKLFIMGTGTPKGWDGTTELTFNEATQAFEYEATVTEDTYLTFGDAEWTSWADFNGKHRFAPAEGNTDAVLDQAVQLVLVNEGCVVLKNAGAYKISVTKDLMMTITASGTGINSIAADDLKNATIYTISGQRVEKAQKGMYIINGKKVVVK